MTFGLRPNLRSFALQNSRLDAKTLRKKNPRQFGGYFLLERKD